MFGTDNILPPDNTSITTQSVLIIECSSAKIGMAYKDQMEFVEKSSNTTDAITALLNEVCFSNSANCNWLV